MPPALIEASSWIFAVLWWTENLNNGICLTTNFQDCKGACSCQPSFRNTLFTFTELKAPALQQVRGMGGTPPFWTGVLSSILWLRSGVAFGKAWVYEGFHRQLSAWNQAVTIPPRYPINDSILMNCLRNFMYHYLHPAASLRALSSLPSFESSSFWCVPEGTNKVRRCFPICRSKHRPRSEWITIMAGRREKPPSWQWVTRLSPWQGKLQQKSQLNNIPKKAIKWFHGDRGFAWATHYK